MRLMIQGASAKLAPFDNLLVLKGAIEKDNILREIADNNSCPDELLWLCYTNEEIEMAGELGIAVCGCLREGEPAFLQTRYVVEDLAEIDLDYLEKVYLRGKGRPWTIGQTQRTQIVELALDDLDELFALYAKPGITDYVEPLFEYEEELNYQKEYIRLMYGYYEYGMWLVRLKETGELIGRAGLEFRECDGVDRLEMGYVIAPEYQRQGYATEVCSFIIDYARENTAYDSLVCLVHEENLPSVALMKKLGFVYEGKTDVTGEELCMFVLSLHKA